MIGNSWFATFSFFLSSIYNQSTYTKRCVAESYIGCVIFISFAKYVLLE